MTACSAILLGVLPIAFTLSSPATANSADSLPAFWVNDNLNTAFTRARSSGKPLMIVLRCLP